MSELLSSSEIQVITGHRQAAAQLRWFKRHGIRAYRSASGHVVATWYAVNHPVSESQGDEPDFDALGGN